jgi:hypothetical protein
LRAVEAGPAHPEPLEDQFDGFYKLKLGTYRLILQGGATSTGSGFRVVFAERRSQV